MTNNGFLACYHSHDYRPNWTQLSHIAITIGTKTNFFLAVEIHKAPVFHDIIFMPHESFPLFSRIRYKTAEWN